MSNTVRSVFKQVPVKVQKLNGFYQSHLSGFSSFIGTLTPVLVDPIMPGQIVSLGDTFRVQLPPMATNFIGKVSAHVRAFFVPLRLLYGGWKEYLMYSGGLADQFRPAGFTRTYLPTFSFSYTAGNTQGELLDYIGVKHTGNFSAISGLNPDPLLAYHLIWSDWYRDPRVQIDPFYHGRDGSDASFCRGTRYTTQTIFSNNIPGVGRTDLLADFVSIFDLRQVNYEKDYFTAAFTDQYGGASPMSVAVAPFVLPGNTSGNANPVYSDPASPGNGLYSNGQSLTQIGTFTIPQVRVANQLERFQEKMALSGGVYQDAHMAEYGVRPSDGLVDRSIYLGSLNASVYNNTVYGTTPSTDLPNNSSNPFAGQQGSSSANSTAIGSGNFVRFQAKEHGIFMVLMDVSPHAVYSTGTRRYLFPEGDGFVDRYCVPSLAGIGHQPIYQAELVGGSFDRTKIFGYTDRYAHLKWHQDELHGLLRDGGSLSAFALQRAFAPTDTPTLNTSFIKVNRTDMDNVSAVSSQISQYGYWCDIFHSYKVVSPLPAYSIPSLEGLENTRTEFIDRNGRRF